MIDDNRVQVRTVNKENTIDPSLNKNMSNLANISKNGGEFSNPFSMGLPSIPKEMMNTNKFGAYVSKLQSHTSKDYSREDEQMPESNVVPDPELNTMRHQNEKLELIRPDFLSSQISNSSNFRVHNL